MNVKNEEGGTNLSVMEWMMVAGLDVTAAENRRRDTGEGFMGSLVFVKKRNLKGKKK
jgi:hypothetical protein